jgi:hypothetical protein
MSFYAIDYEHDKQWEREIQMMDSPCSNCEAAGECAEFGNPEACEKEEEDGTD